MNRILKYSIPLATRFIRTIPQVAQVLCVQMQDGVPCMWVQVDTNSPPMERVFYIYGTGQDMHDSVDSIRYIGTFQDRGYVWHLFEEHVS